ncbi:hypothetical protein QJS04_geneDACA023850 [Acorus gramineus]|uniref:Uncharacterized protein n=1 Tax=Acorus gramineus TaxID=55184 RepID=A0AAV9BPD7_ACOGR|nr:hypothetical protein QJS04_geneDACA023850 [Acorus gramineus]
MAEAAEQIPAVPPLERTPDVAAAATTEVRTREGEEEKDELTCRDAKRRKTCPAALEKVVHPSFEAAEGESSPLDRGGSFTFDTKTSVLRLIETTPKFGTFHSLGAVVVPPDSIEDKSGISGKGEGEGREENAGDKIGI